MAQWRLNTRNAALQQVQTALTGYTVRYPNQSGFNPPNNALWLDVNTIFANDQFRLALTVRDRVDFLIQIDVMMPIGSSDIEAYNIADTLDTGFPIDGTPFSYNGQKVYVKYISPPRPLPITSDADNSWDRYTIRIALYSFVERG